MEENRKAKQRLGSRMCNSLLGTLSVVAAMSGLLTLVSTVLESIRACLVVRHRSRVSGCSLVDGRGDRHIDQSCPGVFDCKGPKAAVGRGVDWEELVEGYGRTCWLILPDQIWIGSL